MTAEFTADPTALREALTEHARNEVIEPTAELLTQTRVKCQGKRCDFYGAFDTWFQAIDAHTQHVTAALLASGVVTPLADAVRALVDNEAVVETVAAVIVNHGAEDYLPGDDRSDSGAARRVLSSAAAALARPTNDIQESHPLPEPGPCSWGPLSDGTTDPGLDRPAVAEDGQDPRNSGTGDTP